LAHNIIGHVSKGVKEPVLSRVFEYLRNVDADLGKRSRRGSGPTWVDATLA
jgi:catalase